MASDPQSPARFDGVAALIACAERRLGCATRGAERLEGGDEAVVLRLDTARGPYVLHVSPRWRTRAELEWVHAVAGFAQRRVPQAVAPLTLDGETLFACEGRLCALFPWIDGRMLERDDPAERADAAQLLAAIHLALIEWPGGERPPSGAARPQPPPDPLELHDPELDSWWASVQAQLRRAPTHGDYYRRNLLCAGRRVVGVIDWHDAVIRPVALEVAGATYELCKDGQGGLRLDRADAFVRTYLDAGGPLSAEERAALPHLMRHWVRNDVRSSLAYGGSPDDDYVREQLRAFRHLRTCGWDPGGQWD